MSASTTVSIAMINGWELIMILIVVVAVEFTLLRMWRGGDSADRD
jgi:hypothetical protein